MAPKTKIPNSSQIEELRQKFNKKYAASQLTEPFHPIDIDRIRNDHLWLQRFLEQYDLDVETSLTKLWETCQWRLSYGTNDLTEADLNQEYLREGCIYVHSQDVDGKPLLIFRVKLHSKTKNLDELIRIVVYWIERQQRENHLTQLTLVFDMAGTGLATMDVDFVRRVVETFKLYYPNSLNYILVFELAWILNAAFRVIKALLPPKAVEILKMISKKDVTQYVPPDKCPVMWGGHDDYEFQFVPESKSVPPKSMAANAGDDDQPHHHQDMDLDKKVHFAKSVTQTPRNPSDSDMGMLQLEPNEYVNICPQSGEAKLKLTNISKEAVAYKIQTTSPDKFRVRPRCGVVLANDIAEVSIWLKPDHQLSTDTKDKFLVMAVIAPSIDSSATEITELWRQKDTTDPDVENHRLVCRLDEKKKGDDQLGRASEKGLKERADQIEAKLNFTTNLQYATLALLVLLFAGFCFLMYNQMQGLGGGSCEHKASSKAFSCPKNK
ncbi:motile sperm domain-containing protein 2 isoform X2 [Drosophila grimshawi]|uniref:motile sperm domain-containing protein 2 isoform X2 n=1 Tax=Drosophila grimshawi TaxID=7222 RepID=UPI001C9320E2|nr:motile sperm domain-containing protein 2 isoform X2 [Drosophila grimshawi]